MTAEAEAKISQLPMLPSGNVPSIAEIPIRSGSTTYKVAASRLLYSSAFDTAQDLRDALADIDTGLEVSTRGVLDTEDGGGGNWQVIDSGALVDNLGTILVSGAKAAVRRNFTEVDPRWFGLASGGAGLATANTAALVAAAALGLPLVIPEGTFYINGQIPVSASVRGAGASKCVINSQVTNSGGHFLVNGASIRISGLALVTANYTTEHGIIVHDAANFRIADCDFVNFSTLGLHQDPAYASIGADVDHCRFVACGSQFGDTHPGVGGTVAGTAGGTSVTFSGLLTPLTGLGLLANRDYVCFDSELALFPAYPSHDPLASRMHIITGISAAGLTFSPPLLVDVSGGYNIMRGGGYMQGAGGQTGSANVRGTTFISCANGWIEKALLGSICTGNIYESNGGSGRVIGSPTAQTVNPLDIGSFAEGHNCGDYQFCAVYQGTIIPGAGAYTTLPRSATWPGSDTPNFVTNQTRIQPTGGATLWNVVPPTISYVTELDGAEDCAVTLLSSGAAPFRPGVVLAFRQKGAGRGIMTAPGGVVIHSLDGATRSKGPGAEWFARYRGDDGGDSIWEVWGTGLENPDTAFAFEDVTGTIVLLQPEGIVNTAGAVATWEDDSGEGNDVAQASGAAQPGYIADWHGHPAIQNGGGDYLQRSTFTGGATGEVTTALWVGEWGGVYAFAFDGESGARFTFGSEDGTGAPCARPDLLGASAPVIASGTTVVALISYDLDALIARLVVLSDGGVFWSATRAIPGATPMNGLNVGCLFGGALFWNGKTAHLQIVDGPVSKKIQANMLARAAEKWGLNLNLRAAAEYLSQDVESRRTYAAAALPGAVDNYGSTIVVRDGGPTGGPIVAVSDGTNWIAPDGSSL